MESSGAGEIERTPSKEETVSTNGDTTGASALVRALEAVGCEVVFGIPGGPTPPSYDPLLATVRIRHILVRHEQGAGHGASGYAQATGRVGFCLATSGP